ncbi:hypothetical protein [Actinomadura geliboluensis]
MPRFLPALKGRHPRCRCLVTSALREPLAAFEARRDAAYAADTEVTP